MALWVFQILFDVFVLGAFVFWLLARKEARRRQSVPSTLSYEASHVTAPSVEMPVTAPLTPESGAFLPSTLVDPTAPFSPSIETPLGSSVSTLSERQAPEGRGGSSGTLLASSPFDAYEKAELLLTKGLSLRDISRQTGLSLAELQLIGKMSQKNQ